MVEYALNYEQQQWLAAQLRENNVLIWRITDVCSDASFRCYHRITHSEGSFILMHFLPDKEDGERILQATNFFLHNGVRVPRLYAANIRLGLILQEDMGVTSLAHHNARKIESHLYARALEELVKIQVLDTTNLNLPQNWSLLEEMELFTEWFLKRWLGFYHPEILSALDDYYRSLLALLHKAPSCCVHRDFHSRNLFILPNNSIGVLDYQDVSEGHFCYDIVSLLKDAYVRLPNDLTEKLFSRWFDTTRKTFTVRYRRMVRQQFHFMTIQRGLKVCGTFARLFLRDGKRGYLKDIPLVMDYLYESIVAAMPQQPQSFRQACLNMMNILERANAHQKIEEQRRLKGGSAVAVVQQPFEKD